MEAKFNIKVIVPDELKYLFEGDNDNLFVAVREKGRILVKPFAEYGIGVSCNTREQIYRTGFVDGSNDGYENGYNRGFEDASHNEEYDPRYRASSWNSGVSSVSNVKCTGDCRECPFYDDIFDICRCE